MSENHALEPKAAESCGGRFLIALGVMVVFGFALLAMSNRAFAPEMYARSGPLEMAEALARGENFAVYDLNINIRELRDEHIARMTETPDVMILGASHWQEAHRWLVPKSNFYNAHVHRDYYEDMLGMVEILVRHDRLPKRLVIAIRDKLFTPIPARRDFLWLPGVPYYRAMARRLGLEEHSTWATLPVQRWRELASLPMLYANVTRFANATVTPQATSEARFEDLDVLLPGGSIIWSSEHKRLFTAERARREALQFAEASINAPPQIDPKGVKAITTLFDFLKEKGVEVILAHPPFNPLFYDRAMQGPYAEGLRRVEDLTRDFARKYDWRIIGSFDPRVVGCTKEMYIDAEHANPHCLSKLLQAVDEPQGGSPRDRPEPEDRVAGLELATLDASTQLARPASAAPIAADAGDVDPLTSYQAVMARYARKSIATPQTGGAQAPASASSEVQSYREAFGRYAGAQAGAAVRQPEAAARQAGEAASRIEAMAADVRSPSRASGHRDAIQKRFRPPVRRPVKIAKVVPSQAVAAKVRSASASVRQPVAPTFRVATSRYPNSLSVEQARRVTNVTAIPAGSRALIWPGDRQAEAAVLSSAQRTKRQ